MSLKYSAHIESWPLRQPFKIANGEWREAKSLLVEISQDGCVGRGEAQGVYYLGETADSIYAEMRELVADIESGLSREELQTRLPPGGARNAIDCAMWDLECQLQDKTVWELLDIDPQPLTSVFTIGLEDTPDAMAAKAAAAADSPFLKIKLDHDRPIEKLAAIRAAREDARIIVDANQGWDFPLLCQVAEVCSELRIDMIEQPLPRGDDAELEASDLPALLGADESCLHLGELDMAARRYDLINIKLDKTGGLTEALALAAGAKERGCQLMIGNMMGTSLAMAPAFVIAQLCDYVDLDGPLLLRHDRPYGIEFDNGNIKSIDGRLWGGSKQRVS